MAGRQQNEKVFLVPFAKNSNKIARISIFVVRQNGNFVFILAYFIICATQISSAKMGAKKIPNENNIIANNVDDMLVFCLFYSPAFQPIELKSNDDRIECKCTWSARVAVFIAKPKTAKIN